MGKHALHTMSRDYQSSIEKKRGFWYYSEEFDLWYYPTPHPANIIRNPGNTSAFYRDIERFTYAAKNGVPKQELPLKGYEVVTDHERAIKVLKFLNKQDRLAWDFETSSLRFYDDDEEVLGIGFCWKPGRAVYIPLLDEGMKRLWPRRQEESIWKGIKKVLENRSIVKDGANTKFDINWARAYDITVHRVGHDVMQFHHLIDENTPANLTYLTTYYDLYFPKYDEEIKPFLRNHNGELTYRFVPIDVLGPYCCADVDATFRIANIQQKIGTKRQFRIYDELSREMSKFTGDMEWNGVLIDVDRIEEMEGKYQEKIDDENKILSAMLKRENFNVNSPPQMQEVLFSDKPGCLNLKGQVKTKTGKWGTGKDTFELLRRKYGNRKRVIRVLGKIDEIRKMRKMKSTYLTGFLKLIDDLNRIHTSYLTTGTVTGRSSSEGPNLQNIPRDPIFRSLFISGPGRKFIAADYSQIEYRMMAWLAAQLNLINKFKDPKFDIHYFNSSFVRGKPIEEIDKEERSFDKAVTFGINYDRSAKAIAETYDLDLNYVQNFINEYWRLYPSMKKWRELQVRLSKRDRYLENKEGRRRNFMAYEWIYSDEMDDVVGMRELVGEDNWLLNSILGGIRRQAINYKIQSYASDVLTRATGRVRKRIIEEGLDAKLVLTVHDMIGLDVADGDVEAVCRILDEEMTVRMTKKGKRSGKTISMLFPVDYDIEDHWVQ
jgi:DNA polymerase-1